MKWHKKQLYVYVGVLKSLEEWKNKEISELKVYAIKSKRKLVGIPVDYDKINEIMQEMDTVAKNIDENKYPRQKINIVINIAFKKNLWNRLCKLKRKFINLDFFLFFWLLKL